MHVETAERCIIGGTKIQHECEKRHVITKFKETICWFFLQVGVLLYSDALTE